LAALVAGLLVLTIFLGVASLSSGEESLGALNGRAAKGKGRSLKVNKPAKNTPKSRERRVNTSQRTGSHRNSPFRGSREATPVKKLHTSIGYG
jgi:hypothetical protein